MGPVEPMILVTGASGRVGADVVKGLSVVGAGARALVRDAAKGEAIHRPGVEVAVGDLARPATLAPALRGCVRVFLCSAADPQQVTLQANVIRAAQEAGVKHIVKLGALGAALDSPVSFSRWHAETEKQLLSSGIPWTFLRPTWFMQNLLAFAPAIRSQGVFLVPLKSGRIPAVDTRDVAAVAVEALTGAGHERKIYDITGSALLSGHDIAAKLAKATGKAVRYVDVAPEEARKGMLGAGEPAWRAEAVVAIYGLFASGRTPPVSPVIEQLTGYPARTFDEWARDNAAAFR